MALRFFRKNQKLVFGLMVVLMLVFLLSSVMVGNRGCSRGGGVMARVGGKKISSDQYQRAMADLQILRDWLAIGRRPTATAPGEALFRSFLMANLRRESEQTQAWMLLVYEAERLGFRSTQQDVDSFLAAIGLTGDDYAKTVANLSTSGLAEGHLRAAIADYLAVLNYYSATRVGAPPSLPELKHAFRDLSEKIELDMVAFAADKFLADVPEPDAAAVEKQFKDHRHVFAGVSDNKTEFGFGYRQPDRVKIAWVLANTDLIQRAVNPTEDEMRKHWQDSQKNNEKLTKRVPVPPKDPAATQPAEPEYKEVVLDNYPEAKPVIRRLRKEAAAEIKVADLFARARALTAAAAKAGVPDPYADAVATITTGPQRQAEAQFLLKTEVGPLPVAEGTLEAMLEQLAELSGVAVVFPLGGEDEKLKVDPAVKISLKGLPAKATVGDILDRIVADLKYPAIQWTTCETLPKALFPTEPINLAPLSAGATAMINGRELYDHDILGQAASARTGGMPLAAIVGRSRELMGPDSTETPLIEKGTDYPAPMFVSGKVTGRMIWRLVDVAPAHDPETMTAEIREQVVKDLKIVAALEKAAAAAKDALAKVRAGQKLADLAKAAKLEVVPSGPFSRKFYNFYFGTIAWSSVPEVGADPAFIAEAFKLAPADVEPPYKDAPAEVVLLPRQRRVMLLQRTGFIPAVASEFQQAAGDLLGILVQARRMSDFQFQQGGVLNTWFELDNIVARLGVVWEKEKSAPVREPMERPSPLDEGV